MVAQAAFGHVGRAFWPVSGTAWKGHPTSATRMGLLARLRDGLERPSYFDRAGRAFRLARRMGLLARLRDGLERPSYFDRAGRAFWPVSK